MFTRRLVLALVLALAVLAACSLQAAESARRFDFPNVGPYMVLRGDFHMHTINSDGKLTTRERVEESKELGYDAIAITDHGTVRAYRVAKYVGDQLGLIVIRGHETGMKGKEHYVVLGVDSTYVPVDSHRWAEAKGEETAFYEEQMENVARHGGIIVWAHPHVELREPTLWGTRQGILVGVELKNDVVGSGWNTIESHGTHWYPNAFEWAMEHNWAVLACTDVHSKRKNNPAVTLLFATERSEKGVMEAIRARRTVAWFDDMLWGRKDLLSRLMAYMVVPSRSPDGKLTLKNLGPV
ncbi:MAG: PHP domain-containing protein, partial [Armatimonadota bacterium]